MKPFLKWAGGKYRIIDQIQQVLPRGNRLIEPFVGSGAVFLNTSYQSYLLADVNADLINLFKQVHDEGLGFIEYAQSFFTPENNTQESFYRLRDEFNITKDIRLKSAIFIYLNRHCFNGLCRYNAKGGFNVPYGKYTKPGFPTKEATDFALKAANAEFIVSDFVQTMEMAQPGDVVYCDPPYVPLSETSNFTSYASGGFGMAEQTKLAEMAMKLRARGVPVVISNHNTDFTQAAYSEAEIFEFDVQRSISSDGKNRNKAKEVLAVFA